MRLVKNGIKRDPDNGGVLIGGGLKWVVALALAVAGYAAGNYVPVRVAAAQVADAAIQVRLEHAESELVDIAAATQRCVERSNERWEKILATLSSIETRLGVIEAGCQRAHAD